MTVADERSAASATLTTPDLPPGHRLVPALIGRTSDTAAHAWVPCPAWCTVPHATNREVAIEDIWHAGDMVDIELPHRDGVELLAYFRLGLDTYSRDESKRRTFVFAEDGTTANGYYMDPAHVTEFCDKAIASLEKLRGMACGIQG